MHFNKPSANTARCKEYICYIHQSNDYVCLLAMFLHVIYVVMMQITKENYCLASVYTLHLLVL